MSTIVGVTYKARKAQEPVQEPEAPEEQEQAQEPVQEPEAPADDAKAAAAPKRKGAK